MDEREELLATVASLYYKLNQSQAEIADRLGVSTSKVSRMLKEARDRGIVDIRIHMPVPRDIAMEQELMQAFALRDALVLQSNNENGDEALLRAVGQLAAGYLQRTLPSFAPGTSIGTAWGTSIYAAVSALPDMSVRQLDAVQLMGGVGSFTVDSPDISRMLAVKLGGRHYDLHAPVLVEQTVTREVLLAEPAVREGLMRARQVKLAIAGIGAVQERSSSFLRAGLLTRGDLARVRDQGAVGEIMGRFFRIDGTTTAIEINERVIGIELDDLRRIPHSLGVARGPTKVEAIYGALRGRLLTVIATDDLTARGVLDYANEQERQLV
jgi:DNA-binding transcriptional regulator LsrR (DeoR family)